MISPRLRTRRRHGTAGALVVGLLASVGCGGDDADDGAEETVAEEEPADGPTPAPTEEGDAPFDPGFDVPLFLRLR